MVRAFWNGTVIAESDDTVVIEGNHYFPADTVRPELLRQSTTTTVCPWKGRASYHTITVDGKENRDAAWFYPNPSSAASAVAGRVAFWHGVKIEDDGKPQRLWLPYRPTKVGEFEYVVEVEHLPDEAQVENNRQQRLVSVRKEQIRVLLVQAYPSWEFRYLKKHLLKFENNPKWI